jgi:D-alanyl-D-alanine dipeptidase
MIKPYQQVPIVECGEKLLPIPLEVFGVENPHPYVKLGAPYNLGSPYFLRETVLSKLKEAQNLLQISHPTWQIQIFDAYRPIAVQQFMVDYAFKSIVQANNLTSDLLTPAKRAEILEQVYQFWAVPSLDPATPPPHSTGAAIDITLTTIYGEIVDMGSPIDEISERSHPNYFANTTDDQGKKYHKNRQILAGVMKKVGFQQHLNEWWHFSYGDQIWAWLTMQQSPSAILTARYGRVE